MAWLPYDLGTFGKIAAEDWTPGSGVLTHYNIIGGSDYNERLYQSNAIEQSTLVWRSENNLAVESVGHGYTPPAYTTSIERTNAYRQSIWIKKEIAGSGEFHRTQFYSTLEIDGRRPTIFTRDLVALDGSNNSIGDNLIVGTLSDTVFPPNQWFLCVNHIYPMGTNFGDIDYKHPDTGIYYPNGDRLSLTNITMYDSTFYTSVLEPSVQIRTWTIQHVLKGSGIPVTSNYYPRVDIVDGREPKIDWLLKHSVPRIVSTNLGKIML